jgi:hypothetical protein
MKRISTLIFLTSLLAVTFHACDSDFDLPPNPYDQVDYVTPPPPVDTLNPNTLAAIHRDILHPKCAVPGCHDGHFEPDFRTIQSAYSTMVYAKVKKNNTDSTFTFRVVPFNKQMSVLHERITNCCFANTNDRMPQDNIGVPLPDADVQRIAAWIEDGARDMMGNLADYPDQAPNILYYIAIDQIAIGFNILSGPENRIDGVDYNPFIMPANTPFVMGMVVEDDSTAMPQLQFNKLRLSYDPDDFSPNAPGYREYSATYFDNPFGADDFWTVNVNTAHFQPGNVVYMRYYVSDGQNLTEMPRNDLAIYYKTFWAFYIQE